MSTTEAEPTLIDLLKVAAQSAGDAEFGDIPAKVISYNAATQTVDVQPLVLVPIRGQLSAVPVVRQVQVRWPAGSTWSIVGELVSGDFGWLRPGGADIGAWRQNAVEQYPDAQPRRNSLSDAVFEPGSQPVSVPLASDSYAAGSLVIKAASLLLGDSTASAFVALASLVDAHLTTLQTAHDTHNHPTAPTGPVSVPSVIVGTLSSVAATKVKAK